MADEPSVPPEASQHEVSAPPDAAELEEALKAANLPEDERAAVENALNREDVPDPEEVLGSDPEEEVLASGHPDESLAVRQDDAEETGLDEVLAEPAGTEDEMRGIGEERPSQIEREEVGGENVAAAAAGETGALPQDVIEDLVADAGEPETDAETLGSQSTPDSEAAVSQDVLDSLLADVEQTPPPTSAPDPATQSGHSAPWSRRKPHASNSASLRLIASITVGLLGTLVVFYLLSSFRLRPLTSADLASTMRQTHLESLIEQAQVLMDEGRHGDAADLLRDAISTGPTNALVVEAEYLYLEALSHSIPNRLSREVAAELHSMVDRLIELAPLHPGAPAALLLNAKVFEAEENSLAARKQYRDILKDYPDAANTDEVLLAAGQLELELERPIEAGDYFDRLLAEYPASPHTDLARLHMGDALQLAGNYDGARVTFVRLAQAYPNTPVGDKAFERLGRLAFETGDYESAIRELESRLTLATSIEGNDRVYLLLAKTYAAAGDPVKAQDLLRELLDFFPESEVTPLAHAELAKVQSLMGLDRDATRTATQAVERYPNHATVLKTAGELLARAERFDAAAACYERAYRGGETDPALLYEAARLYGEAEQFDSAERNLNDLQRDHATDPLALDATILWATLQFEQGQITAAIDRLEVLADLTREREQELRVKSVMADLYDRIGFGDESARIHAEIPELTSEPAMLARSAESLLAAGNFEDGLSIAERVEVGRLNDKQAYRFLVAKGKALMGGDLRRALDTLENAHEIYPLERSPEGDALLMRANLAAGRTARARAVMVDMRSRFGGDPDAARWLVQAANGWGDYLYKRRDYRAAADAYSYALSESRADAGTAEIWAVYQRANALYKMAEFEESLELYRQVAESASPWAAEATSKIDAVKLDMRMRGIALRNSQEPG